VKTIKNSILAIFFLALLGTSLTTPALAERNRSNRGGARRGDLRSDEVRAEKKHKDQDKDRDRDRDNDKNKGKHKGETWSKHNCQGHRH